MTLRGWNVFLSAFFCPDSDLGAVALYCGRRHQLELRPVPTFRPRDLADRMARRRDAPDGFLRETFSLPRDEARAKARDFLKAFPKEAYMSRVESWRELPGGAIEFTMRRLRTAD